ncbi:hypothetical protein DQ239_14945 [Blastococcus sp. TF02-09]|uniref:PD-(D/E)XK motif protein n=1 Tax=Blastococcus sp. TF02-09 TaxID=2250576 RepID=UPI000DE92358|nr:PD-(D/E)XK motif protein [Blastococcus sp. TF02-9]RBY76275.1 hypothetical protein DQ239_14945 [Blastococcus sp. TF02-9]
MRDDLTAAFHALSQSREAGEQLMLSVLPVTTPEGRVAAALSFEGTRHLLVPIPVGTPVASDRRSKSVTIERRELIVEGDRRLYIDVACHQPELGDLFERLASEICERLAAKPQDYLLIPSRTLSRWRQLLEDGREPLSASQLVGVFGELWVLRRMVEVDPLRRVDHWGGPSRAVHDFGRGGMAVEVKTSTARSGRMVEIHGADQLDVSSNGKLALVYLRVRESADGVSVGGLIAALEAAGADPASLDELLTAAGVRHRPMGPTFEVVEEAWFLVDENFPRITPSAFVGGIVPDGVLALNYRLDLSTSPAPMSGAEQSRWLKELADS